MLEAHIKGRGHQARLKEQEAGGRQEVLARAGAKQETSWKQEKSTNFEAGTSQGAVKNGALLPQVILHPTVFLACSDLYTFPQLSLPSPDVFSHPSPAFRQRLCPDPKDFRFVRQA